MGNLILLTPPSPRLRRGKKNENLILLTLPSPRLRRGKIRATEFPPLPLGEGRVRGGVRGQENSLKKENQ